MDLEAAHDEDLAQKDQANAPFPLHGSGSANPDGSRGSSAATTTGELPQKPCTPAGWQEPDRPIMHPIPLPPAIRTQNSGATSPPPRRQERRLAAGFGWADLQNGREYRALHDGGEVYAGHRPALKPELAALLWRKLRLCIADDCQGMPRRYTPPKAGKAGAEWGRSVPTIAGGNHEVRIPLLLAKKAFIIFISWNYSRTQKRFKLLFATNEWKIVDCTVNNLIEPPSMSRSHFSIYRNIYI